MRGTAPIVGGGIAGLGVARGLHAGGWSVQVRERSAGPPRTGTALGMWPAAMAALDALDVGDIIRDRSVERSSAAILRPDGSVIATVRSPSVHLVSRPDLLAALLEGLPAETVAWNSPVHLTDDLSDADVIVGADGIHSVVRAAVQPDAVPFPLGTVAFRGTAPGSTGRISETWGRGRIFGITPQHPDTTNWFACVRAELLNHHQPELSATELLHRLYSNWHPDIARVLHAIEDAQIDRRTLLQLPPLRTYADRRHVLVGDAAHAMAPNLGRGACESLVDAFTLAEALTAAVSVEDGLRRYDRLRRSPTRHIAYLSRRLNRISSAERCTGMRDALLRVLA